MYPICLMAPYPKLYFSAKDMIEEAQEPIEVRRCFKTDGVVSLAKEFMNKGVKIIISRGGVARTLKEHIDIPIVEIKLAPITILRAIKKATSFGRNIGLIGYENFFYYMHEYEEILDVKIFPAIFEKDENSLEKSSKVLELSKKVDCIVGGQLVFQTAKKIGVPSVIIESEKEYIREAIDEAKRIRDIIFEEKRKYLELKTILDYTDEGIINIAYNGQVKYFNNSAFNIIRNTRTIEIGAHISSIFREFERVNLSEENITSGQSYQIEENIVISDVIPIRVNNKVSSYILIIQDIANIQTKEEEIRKKLYLKGHIAKYNFGNILVQSEKMKKIIQTAKSFAQMNSTVLLVGETGTGKELFAHSIHNASHKRKKPFVAVNCAALPKNLLESELFGYDEGAFTGAKKGGKKGLFELAHGGIIFLDEIGEVSLNIQIRLLRVIQEREVMRVGSDKVIPIDVRIITATNKDLKHLIKEKKFREDLYYRLNVLKLRLPGLSERRTEIPGFVEMFIDRYSRLNNTGKKTITKNALELLQRLDWNGNIRELQNIIERLVILSSGEIIDLPDLQAILEDEYVEYESGQNATNPDSYVIKICINRNLKDIEKDIIKSLLEYMSHDQNRVADTLCIGKTTLWRRLKEIGVTSSSLRD